MFVGFWAWLIHHPFYATASVVAVVLQATDITIDGVPLVGLTAPTILGIFFIMFMRGDIIPGKVHRERVQDYKEEAEAWKKAHDISENARSILNRQNSELIEVGKTVQAIAHAIRVNIELPPEGGPRV